MESALERAERIARLETARAMRGSLSAVTEIAPGRGDLSRTSVPVGPGGTLMGLAIEPTSINTVDDFQISYAKLFAEQAWVAAAVMRMLTWAVRVPLKVYRRTGDDSRVRLRPDEHPLATAIARPWPGGYPAALTMSLLGPFLVHGNSVMELDEGARGAIMFEPHDWRTVTPIKPSPNAQTIDGWQVWDEIGRAQRKLSADNVVHAKWWSPLGPEGISALRQLGVTLSIDNAAQRYQRAQFRNGARPPSAITATAEFLGLDKDVRDALLLQLREDVTALYAGPENGGRPALLPPGLDWKPVGHTSREAELIEQRYINREEVAAVYQIPPPMLGDLRRATFANIVELRQVAYTDGLGPPLVIIEQVLTAVYQELSRERDVYVEFDFAGVLRGDFLKEVNALRLAITSGLMTPNEGRAVQNRPASDDPRANELWMPWNNVRPMSEPPPENANRAARRAAARAEAEAAAAAAAEDGAIEAAEDDAAITADEPTAEEAIA